MTPKEYLNQVRFLDIKINNKLKEVENLKEMALTLKSSSFEEKVQISKESGDSIGESIARVIDLEREITNDIDNLIAIKKVVIETIDSIGDSECIDLLYKRYINYSTWEQIAVDMKYTIRNIYNIHGRALELINKTLH